MPSPPSLRGASGRALLTGCGRRQWPLPAVSPGGRRAESTPPDPGDEPPAPDGSRARRTSPFAEKWSAAVVITRSTGAAPGARAELGLGAEPALWKYRRRGAETGRCCPGGATPSDRPELSSMADDYARYAL